MYISVDLDQLAYKKPADQDIRCFQNKVNPDSAWETLINEGMKQFS